MHGSLWQGPAAPADNGGPLARATPGSSRLSGLQRAPGMQPGSCREAPTWRCLCGESVKQHGGLHPTLAHRHRWLCRTKRQDRGLGALG